MVMELLPALLPSPPSTCHQGVRVWSFLSSFSHPSSLLLFSSPLLDLHSPSVLVTSHQRLNKHVQHSPNINKSWGKAAFINLRILPPIAPLFASLTGPLRVHEMPVCEGKGKGESAHWGVKS